MLFARFSAGGTQQVVDGTVEVIVDRHRVIQFGVAGRAKTLAGLDQDRAGTGTAGSLDVAQ